MSIPSRILYVDDSKDLCDSVRALLQNSDLPCTVISTESAKDARLLIVKERFDFYIFDYSMPEISGVELCRCVRRFDSTTPVMFFSATAEPSAVAEATEAGADEYLIKPTDLGKLSAVVKRLLDEHSLARKQQTAAENEIRNVPETSSEENLPSDKLQPAVSKRAYLKIMANSLKTRSGGFPVKVGDEEEEKRLKPNRIQPSVSVSQRARPILTGAAIFAVIVLHFAAQFVFFRGEKIVSENETVNRQNVEIKAENEKQIVAAEPENQPDAEIKTEYDEARNLTARTTPGDVVQPKSKFEPEPAVIKKKETRESKAERLRRAEKILTGI